MESGQINILNAHGNVLAPLINPTNIITQGQSRNLVINQSAEVAFKGGKEAKAGSCSWNIEPQDP